MSNDNIWEGFSSDNSTDGDLSQADADMSELTSAASALFRMPVFFSHQNLFTLGPSEQQFVIRMFQEIKRVLLFPRTLPNTEQYPNTALENIRRIVNSSYGCASALLKQTSSTAQGEPYSPFVQIEPTMAFQRGLPLLLVKENTVPAGGIWGDNSPLGSFMPIIWQSGSTTVDQFFSSVEWKEALQNWAVQVRSGYFIQTGPEFEYTRQRASGI